MVVGRDFQGERTMVGPVLGIVYIWNKNNEESQDVVLSEGPWVVYLILYHLRVY